MSAPPARGKTARAVWRRLGLLADDAPPSRPMTVLSAVVISVLGLALAYLFVGLWFVAVTAALLFVTLRFNRDPGRPFAFAVVVLLAGAATVSVVFVPPGESDPLITFARERTLAAELGSFAGVFWAIATMMFAVMERPPRSRRGRAPSWTEQVRRAWSTSVPVLNDVLVRWWLIAAAALVGGVLRVAAAPRALPEEVTPLLENLRLGTMYATQVGGGATPDASWPPLGVAIVAYLPMGAGPIALAVSVATVIGAGIVAQRRWGRAAGATAAWVVALVPSCWALSLNELAAAALLLVVLGLALRPRSPSLGWAFGAGAVAGAAILARPDAVVAAVALAIVLVRRVGSDRGAARRANVALVWVLGAFVVLSPWLRYVAAEFGAPYLASSVDAVLRDPVAIAPGGVVGLGSLVGAAALLVGAAWAATAATGVDREAVIAVLVAAGSSIVAGVIAGELAAPLSWSAPLLAVVVAGVNPWRRPTAGGAPQTRSDPRDRTSSPTPVPAGTHGELRR